MTYEIAKKIVCNDDSKIFKNWHEYTGISKENFLDGIKWLCEEPRYYTEGDACGKLRRELGIRKDGSLVHMKRVYSKDLAVCTFYEDVPLGSRFTGAVCSLSAKDQI